MSLLADLGITDADILDLNINVIPAHKLTEGVALEIFNILQADPLSVLQEAIPATFNK